MNNYYSISNKYNRILVLVLMLSPFVAYVTFGILNLDFNRVFIVFTYLGVALVLFFGNKKNPIKIPTYLWFYLLFVLYDYYSTFFILDREFKMSYLASNHAVGSFNILLIVENLSINKKHYNFLFKLCKKILIIAILVIVVQQVVNVNFFIRPDKIMANITSSDNEDRLYSIYSWYGMYGPGLSFIPIFVLILEDVDKRNQKQKLLLWILLGIIFALLSKARWIMINTVLSFLVLIITKKHKFKYILKYMTIVPFILILFFLGSSVAGVDASGIVEERILESGERTEKKSASTRILAFVAFNKFYWRNPVFGIGNIKYGMGGTDRQDYELQKFLAGRSSQIHVGYLSVLYMYGLVGGMFLFLCFYFILKKLRKNAKLTRHWAPYLGMLGLVVCNLTLVTWSFLELGLVFAVLSDKFFLQEYKRKKSLNQLNMNVQ